MIKRRRLNKVRFSSMVDPSSTHVAPFYLFTDIQSYSIDSAQGVRLGVWAAMAIVRTHIGRLSVSRDNYPHG